MKKSHTLWTEIYRPDNLDNYVGQDTFKAYLAKCIESKDLQHLILYGKTGTGKTTAAKLITKNIECEYLYINGSDENGIDTVRDKIKEFVSVASWTPLKIVILDDCQNFTQAAQQALLNLIETYSKTARFIFTCNALGKLIPALQSRCAVLEVSPPSRKEVGLWLSEILEKESIDYEVGTFVEIVERYYPDIRKCLNALQSLSVGGKLSAPGRDFSLDYLEEVFKILIGPGDSTKWTRIKQLVADYSIQDFSEVYRVMYDKCSQIAPNDFPELCIYINEAQYESSFVPDREITFMACIAKILNLIK